MEATDAYRALAPKVLGYLRARGAAEPEDLLGEVFLQVARDLPRFKGDGDEDLRRWVFVIARNRLIDAGRRRQRQPVTPVAEVPETADHAEPALPDADLIAAMAGLTDDQREVVALRFVADLPLADVAELTGSNVNAVKQMQHRALAALREALADTTTPSSAE